MTTPPKGRTLVTADEEILDCAKISARAGEIADMEGLDNLTLTQLADRLGVSRRALYRLIDGYDGLVAQSGLAAL